MDYITLDNFEGPLDLLLHLVKESNIDICDISIAVITDKYLEYINREENLNINVSSSYLVMASELMYIKSKSLLPTVKEENEDDDELTRENLINKLLEYKRYKELTPKFRQLEDKRKEIYIKGPEKISNYIDSISSVGSGSIEDLLEAFKKFLQRKEDDKPLERVVTSKEYSVHERKNRIKTILKEKKKVYFEELFEEYNKPYIVVTFLSILEMVKEKEVVVRQENNFKQILVELRD